MPENACVGAERGREAAERTAGVTKTGLGAKRQIGCSRSAHMLCSHRRGAWTGALCWKMIVFICDRPDCIKQLLRERQTMV